MVVGHSRSTREARVDMNEGGAPFFGFYNPLKSHRVRFRHIGTHNKDAVAVAHVAREVGAGSKTE